MPPSHPTTPARLAPARPGAFDPLRPLERWLIALGLPALAIGFGWVTLARSAFMSRPMTDADVFFRAAWAVRSGADLYTITDVNGWHYLYPSLFAVLMWPFANPPPGEAMPLTMPFAVSVALWYACGIAFLALAAHWLARAVELSSDDPAVCHTPPFCRRWWSLRIWPVLIGLVAIGSTLSRGQVGTLLLMLLAGMLLSAVRGHRFRAGLWLAAAITLKVIPAFLLLYPLWRRDARWLTGSAVGLVLGLVLLPSLALGPAKAWEYNRRWLDVMVLERLGPAEAASRFDELHTMRKIDNQSPLSVIHHWQHFGTPLDARPTQPTAATKLAHLAVAAAATLATLWAAGLWRTRSASGREHLPLVIGLLLNVMLLASPVTHPDYFILVIPTIAALWSLALENRRSADAPSLAWLAVAVYVLAHVLPRFESLWELKMYGLAMFAGLGVWALGLTVLRAFAGRPEVGRLGEPVPPLAVR